MCNFLLSTVFRENVAIANAFALQLETDPCVFLQSCCFIFIYVFSILLQSYNILNKFSIDFVIAYNKPKTRVQF